MNLKKYQRGYLGGVDSVLEDRSSDRCAGIELEGIVFAIGEPTRVEEDTVPVGGSGMDIVALTTSLALFTYNDGGSKLHARLVTMTPGKANLAVTVGNEQLASTINSFSVTSVCRMTATTVMVVYLTSGGNVGCRLLTVSGATVSTGAEATFTASGSPKIEFFGTNQAVVCYQNSGSKTATRVLDLSGTTITPGTELVVSSAFGLHPGLSMIEAGGTGYICTYLNSASGGHIRGRVCTVSGSTVTNPGADTILSAISNTTASPVDVKMNDASHGIVTWAYASSVIRSATFTVNAGTGAITAGTQIDRAELGVIPYGALLPSNHHILSYDGKPSDTPQVSVVQMVDSGTPPVIVEIKAKTLGSSGLSFDSSVATVEAEKFVGIYKDFSVTGYMFVYTGSI